MAAAPPFVSYSTMTEAVVPAADWPSLYSSMQAQKAHVQEYPGAQRYEVFVAVEGEDVHIHCYTTWDTPEQLDIYVERGYTFERLLADVGAPAAERSLVMEKIF